MTVDAHAADASGESNLTKPVGRPEVIFAVTPDTDGEPADRGALRSSTHDASIEEVHDG